MRTRKHQNQKISYKPAKGLQNKAGQYVDIHHHYLRNIQSADKIKQVKFQYGMLGYVCPKPWKYWYFNTDHISLIIKTCNYTNHIGRYKKVQSLPSPTTKAMYLQANPNKINKFHRHKSNVPSKTGATTRVLQLKQADPKHNYTRTQKLAHYSPGVALGGESSAMERETAVLTPAASPPTTPPLPRSMRGLWTNVAKWSKGCKGREKGAERKEGGQEETDARMS